MEWLSLSGYTMYTVRQDAPTRAFPRQKVLILHYIHQVAIIITISILWNSIALTIIVTELANTMKYGGGGII